jgi:hypothetical protein
MFLRKITETTTHDLKYYISILLIGVILFVLGDMFWEPLLYIGLPLVLIAALFLKPGGP